MALILCIDTSTTVCSVALSQNGNLIGHKALFENNSHASNLTVMIEQLLIELNIKMQQLSAVAVSSGPGSYTGLRIGVSTAKGLCYALSIPLIAINSLSLLVVEAISQTSKNKEILFCPMIDARRMEVYTAVYNHHMELIEPISAKIIEPNSFENFLKDHHLYLFGNGSDKCKNVLVDEKYHYLDNLVPLAKNMIELAENAYQKEQFEDVAYFEPFYLKDFVATTPKG